MRAGADVSGQDRLDQAAALIASALAAVRALAALLPVDHVDRAHLIADAIHGAGHDLANLRAELESDA